MTYDIKAYKSKEDYDNGNRYFVDGYTSKKEAIKEAKTLLKEGYKLAFVHSADDEVILPVHKE